MHPALKLFCILWLFMGAMAAAVGLQTGAAEYGIIGVVLAGLSISGIVGFRAAPSALMFFWLSMLLCYIVLFATGRIVDLPRAVLPCLMFLAFAFVSFLCGEPMPSEEDTGENPESQADSSPAEPE